MLLLDQICLKRIEQVRFAAQGVENAYLLRTRLHRLALSLDRLIQLGGANALGLTQSETSNLKALTRELRQETRFLSQKSTVLDDNWEDGWHELNSKISQIELLLKRQLPES